MFNSQVNTSSYNLGEWQEKSRENLPQDASSLRNSLSEYNNKIIVDRTGSKVLKVMRTDRGYKQNHCSIRRQIDWSTINPKSAVKDKSVVCV